MPTIDILLATYNGARYLPELLASLERQTFGDWRLVARDDGSSDSTVELLEAWGARCGGRLHVVADGRSGLGASASFGLLLEASGAPYFAPCDQDDVWLPEKLAALLADVRAAERRRGAETPVLAHGDLVVVDDALAPLHTSFRAYKGFTKPAAAYRLPQLVLQNVVTGCASLGNAALRAAACPVPAGVMHDWWLAMTAAVLGEIVDSPEAVVLYRQHGENAIGARSWTPARLARRLARSPRSAIEEARRHVARTQHRAGAFVERYRQRLDPDTAGVLSAYAALGDRPFRERKTFLLRNTMWTDSRIANLAMLAVI